MTAARKGNPLALAGAKGAKGKTHWKSSWTNSAKHGIAVKRALGLRWL